MLFIAELLFLDIFNALSSTQCHLMLCTLDFLLPLPRMPSLLTSSFNTMYFGYHLVPLALLLLTGLSDSNILILLNFLSLASLISDISFSLSNADYFGPLSL